MSRGCRLAAAVIVAAAAVAALIQSGRSEAPRQEVFRRSFPVMGTAASVCFYDTQRELAERAFTLVLQEFDTVSHACNLYDDTSELVQLNRTAAAEPFTVSPLLAELIAHADYAYNRSRGVFDPSIKPLMDLWGFYRKRQQIPRPDEVKRVRELTGWDNVKINRTNRTVSFARPGMALDFGGIAKGYALDRAAAAVEKLGVRCGVIDLGGNLRLLSEPPPGEPCYRVAVKDPGAPHRNLEKILELRGNCAVSTSGHYERFVVLEGKKFGHIIDPVTGEAPVPPHAVTVVAPSAVAADWASTALYLRGEGLGNGLREEGIISSFRFYPGGAQQTLRGTTSAGTWR